MLEERREKREKRKEKRMKFPIVLSFIFYLLSFTFFLSPTGLFSQQTSAQVLFERGRTQRNQATEDT
jgi:E3 ubiquitin-protein ligase DOA10